MDRPHNRNISMLLTLTDAHVWYGTSQHYIWGLVCSENVRRHNVPVNLWSILTLSWRFTYSLALFLFALPQCTLCYVTGLLLQTAELHRKDCIMLPSVWLWCWTYYMHSTYFTAFCSSVVPFHPITNPLCLNVVVVMHLNALHINHSLGSWALILTVVSRHLMWTDDA